MKIKSIILGLSALSMLSLTACDNSSFGTDAINPIDSFNEQSLSELLVNSNYIFDFTNSLKDNLDPDTAGLNPMTNIQIRLTTDLGSDEGVILLEEKYEDMRIALPIDTIFSPKYYNEMSQDYAKGEYRMRAFITSDAIRKAIIKDLRNSEIVFDMTESQLHEINPKITILASDIEEASGFESIDQFPVYLAEGINATDDLKINGEADVNSFTSIKYDIISDEMMADVQAKRTFVYIEDIETTQTPEQKALTDLNDRIYVANAKSIEALTEKNGKAALDKIKLNLKIDAATAEAPATAEPTPAYSKGDL